MPVHPLRALVLRKTKLGETDLIVTLLASDGRQIRAVAKGARKTTSRIGGWVEPYSVVDLLLHAGGPLEIIAEAGTVASNEAVRRDCDRAAAAAAVGDLLGKISVGGQAESHLFEIACVTLDVVNTAPTQAPVDSAPRSPMLEPSERGLCIPQ